MGATPVTALWYAAIGLTAGAALAFQAVVNTQLRVFAGTVLRASLVSYIGGLVCCIAALLILRQPLSIPIGGFRDNALLWTGGAYGLLYIAFTIWLIPRIGSGAAVALVVAGQLIASLTFDHIGILGIPRRPIDLPKIAGVAMLVAGAVLIRR